MGTTPSVRNFLGASFRLNPECEIVPFDDLIGTEKDALSALKLDPSFYGVVRSRLSGFSLKSICHDTAHLLYSLRNPSPIPSHARAKLGEQCLATVAKLVLDSVLEISTDDGFVSGGSAHSAVFDLGECSPLRGQSELTISALKYAQSLNLEDSYAISTRLYGYNRLPATPAWRRKLPTESAVMAFFDLEQGTRNACLLERNWKAWDSANGSSAWLGWTSKRRQPYSHSERSFKLYVSPLPECLPDCFREALAVGTESGARALKVAKDVYGVLRPDKLILYFDTEESMTASAAALKVKLRGIPGHRVPFTAAIDNEGILSWGVDPPSLERLLPWQGPSWRSWITDRIAVALTNSRSVPFPLEPWQAALDRVSLESVNILAWQPLPELWQETILQ